MAQGYQSAPSEWMGLAFFVLDSKGVRLLGHTGSQAGFRSFFYFNPVTGAAVVAVFNTTNASSPARGAQGRMNAAALDLLR
jgi:CubicO group peptidase (beta-lactamase class C family)